ncbi:hypothetical protein [Nocardia carnea]|uniref:hypothetical protein n=1 Tax=Nocardia carnea TaxID=37328 RepID=UPI00245439C4|nr:hypothetical protein [Nocardia carnea]
MPLQSANNLDLNGHKLLNVDEGTAAGDAVNRGQLDANSTADRNRANHTGTQLASTISNFAASVQALAWASMLAPSAAVNINNQQLENLADPTDPQDAATKNYVDDSLAALVSGQTFKGLVEVAHAANVNLAAPGTATFDGQTIATGAVVLLTGQTDGTEDGPYVFNGTAAAMTRAANWDTAAEAVVGSYWIVLRGTQADKFALLANDTFTLDTDTPAFVFIGAASGGGGSATSFAANAGTGSAGPYTVVHGLGSTDVDVSVRELAGGFVKLVAWRPTDANTVSIEPDETWGTNSHRVYVTRIA